MAVPPEIEKQVRVSIECMNVLRLVWMDRAPVDGLIQTGHMNTHTRAFLLLRQFAGLVGQAQVNGRNNRGNNLRVRVFVYSFVLCFGGACR